MAKGAKKAASYLIRMVSMAGTGYTYVTRKNPRNVQYKLKLMKHDPVVNRHVLFVERKMK